MASTERTTRELDGEVGEAGALRRQDGRAEGGKKKCETEAYGRGV